MKRNDYSFSRQIPATAQPRAAQRPALPVPVPEGVTAALAALLSGQGLKL